MKFHLMALTFLFFNIGIATTAGRSLRDHTKRTQSRVNRTIRVADLEKNNSRRKFLSLGPDKFMVPDSQQFLVRNQVDDVFSWLASVEQLEPAGNRFRFEQFLRFQLK